MSQKQQNAQADYQQGNNGKDLGTDWRRSCCEYHREDGKASAPIGFDVSIALIEAELFVEEWSGMRREAEAKVTHSPQTSIRAILSNKTNTNSLALDQQQNNGTQPHQQSLRLPVGSSSHFARPRPQWRCR
jgi:hypothetical protein